MIRRAAFGIALALLAMSAYAADAPKCRLARVAEWPVRLLSGTPVAEGEINGKKVNVLLDTGAWSSVITRASADRLELATRRTGRQLEGFGGASRVLTTRVDDLRIAGASAKDIRVSVAGERPIRGVDMVLGDDFFQGSDLELDYAAGVVRLFQPTDCGNAVLAYWDRDALVLPMEDSRHVIVPITVNGRETRAMIDSGATGTVVQLVFASRLGIKPGGPGVTSASCTAGIGADDVHSWVARFDSVSLGAETIRDARLRIAEYAPDLIYRRNALPEVILGGDFLRSHRVYISRKQMKVYFTYTGGLVFPTMPALDCDERLRGKNAAEVLAIYDQALKRDPADARARIARGVLLLRQHDAAGAIKDLDLVIAAEPANAVALSSRSIARMSLGDYDGALADSEAAVANGMRTAQMYAVRATIRRAQGDASKALEELDEALRLDPHHVASLRARAALLQELGRSEDAKKDLATLAAMHVDEPGPGEP